MSETRRTFVQSTGAAALASQIAVAANDRIGLGFIGVGIRGTILLEGFKSIAGVQPLIAADVYDGHLTRSKELTDGAIETTREYRKVLDRKDVDAVVIATPDHWHRQMTLDALDAGKHVYIEKPMVWSIEQGHEIMAAVKKSGRLLQVGSGAKTSMVTAKCRELVKSGVLGKVNMVRMENNRNSAEGAWVYPIPPDASPQTIDWAKFLGPAPKRPFDPRIFFRWRCWWEYSGGVATDLFVHMLSQLHEVMDVTGPKSVVSQGGIYRWKDGRTVPDTMNSVYEYPGEFLADLYVNLGNSHSSRGMLIMGSEGALEESRGGLTLYPESDLPRAQRYATASWPAAMQKQYFESLGFDPQGRASGRQEPKKPQEIRIERGPSHHEYFIRSLRDGSPSKENAADGYYAAGAAHLANQAFEQGRRMQWDLQTGKVTAG